tara:strand:- start:482 stop:1075 length:594 start_codon:yes stop_codon:yes gene_type:complete
MNTLVPKYLTFGADIKNIEFKENIVIKTFKNKNGYQKTIYFYNLIDTTFTCFPELISNNENQLQIITSYCGDLVNLYNLPDNWKEQINYLRHFFLIKKILILDIRFMPHTPYVINNLCIRKDKIYLVDLTLYNEKDEKYINNYFDNLILNIELRLRNRDNMLFLFILHIILEFYRLINDLFEKIFHFYNHVTYRKYS